MLDIKRIKEDPQAVKAGLHAKEVDCDAAIDRILELDEERRALIASTETRKAQQNKVSKEIPALKKAGKDVAPVFAEIRVFGCHTCGKTPEADFLRHTFGQEKRS